MQKGTAVHTSYLFTVRIWVEDQENGQTRWYGKVQFIPSGETCYFLEWPTLLAFMERFLTKPEEE
jgi:hypothetical protein